MTLGEYRRHLLVGVDVKSYGSANDIHQFEIQKALSELLNTAGSRAGLNRSRWKRQPGGDGELAVLPENESEARVVDHYTWEIHMELSRHNRDQPERRLRLRMGIHYGVVKPAPLGFAGKGIVQVSRILDSEVARRAQSVSDTDLIVIVSRQVYEDTIEQSHTSRPASLFRHVEVRNKEFRDDAWLYIPGGDANKLRLEECSTSAPAASGDVRATRPTIETTIRGEKVEIGDANFGFQIG